MGPMGDRGPLCRTRSRISLSKLRMHGRASGSERPGLSFLHSVQTNPVEQ
jgi:hypothetical protein